MCKYVGGSNGPNIFLFLLIALFALLFLAILTTHDFWKTKKFSRRISFCLRDLFMPIHNIRPFYCCRLAKSWINIRIRYVDRYNDKKYILTSFSITTISMCTWFSFVHEVAGKDNSRRLCPEWARTRARNNIHVYYVKNFIL